MKLKFILLLILLIFNNLSKADVVKDSLAKNDSIKFWKFKGNASLSFGQTSYKYWSQGGENSLSSLANYKMNLKYKNQKAVWENNFEAIYGIMQQGERKIIKTDDKFEFISNYSYKASERWFYNGMINLKSQFTKGYKYPNDSTVVSDFFSPAQLITSFGFEYRKRYYNLIFSVLTGKTTFVTNTLLSDAGAYGVEKGKKFKAGVGSFFKFTFKKEIIDNVELNNRLELYSDYFNKPEYIDVYWEVMLKMKINKFMYAAINTTLIYDNDTKYTVKDQNGNIISSLPKVQFKEAFALAFTIDI